MGTRVKTGPKKQKNARSRYWGVSPQANGFFRAQVRAEGEAIYAGEWLREIDAALARDRAVLHLNLDRPFNDLKRARRAGAASPDSLVRLATQERRELRTASGYLGVTWRDVVAAWEVTVWLPDGRCKKVACIADVEEAARAYDRVARYLLGDRAKLNFPEIDLPPATIAEIRREARAAVKERTSSRFRGVTRVRNKWVAQIMVARKHRALGTYLSEEEAARAYDRAARPAFGDRAVLNFPTPHDRLAVEAQALATLKR